MKYVSEMLASHPHGNGAKQNQSDLAACIEACYACAQACTACADACLGEANVQQLVRCIRLNLDCADVCETTGRMLSRRSEAHSPLLRKQLELCAAMCQTCGDECDKHAHHHAHCRVCRDACRACADACQTMLTQVSAMA